MNTRYRIRFERSGVSYAPTYASTIERARARVWVRFSDKPPFRPARAYIDGTRDVPCLGSKPNWDVRESYQGSVS